MLESAPYEDEAAELRDPTEYLEDLRIAILNAEESSQNKKINFLGYSIAIPSDFKMTAKRIDFDSNATVEIEYTVDGRAVQGSLTLNTDYSVILTLEGKTYSYASDNLKDNLLNGLLKLLEPYAPGMMKHHPLA